MKKVTSILLLAMACGGAKPQSQMPLPEPTPASTEVDADVLGTWKTTIEEGKLRMRMRLVFANQDGKLGCHMAGVGANDKPLPCSEVKVSGKRVSFALEQFKMAYEGELDAQGLLTGAFKQEQMTQPVAWTRGDFPPPARPQEPTGEVPYMQEDVSFAGGGKDVALAGTLTMPSGPGPFPAVVLLSAGGPDDRNATQFGHKPFWVLADQLTRAGIAVLRMDDRGVGASKGDFGAATAQDHAADALAVIAKLRQDKRIAPSRIGILGQQEGAMVGAMVGAKDPKVSFVVMLSGAGHSGTDLLIDNATRTGKAQGATEEQLTLQRTLMRATFETARQEATPEGLRTKLKARLEKEIPKDQLEKVWQAVEADLPQLTKPAFRSFLLLNPAEYVSKIKAPILALWGERDVQISAESNKLALSANRKKRPHKHDAFEIHKGLNHLLQHATTGELAEIGEIEETMAPEVIKQISTWILTHK